MNVYSISSGVFETLVTPGFTNPESAINNPTSNNLLTMKYFAHIQQPQYDVKHFTCPEFTRGLPRR